MEDRPYEGPAPKSWLVVQLDVVLFDDRGPPRFERSALPMLLSPFRSGPAHIVQLGAVWVERGPKPTRLPKGRIEAVSCPTSCEQHSCDIRM
jgi:hypothetical protein